MQSARVVTITFNPSLDRTCSVKQVMADKKLRCEDVQLYPAGGGVNVARAMVHLGLDPCALWSCGGHVGARLADMLTGEGVTHEPVPIGAATRENVVVQETGSGRLFRFNMPGPALSHEELERWRECILGLAPPADYLVVSGSMPPGVPADWLGSVLLELRSSTRVVLDTKGETLRDALRARVFAVKPNIAELSDLAGDFLDHDADTREAAMDLVRRRVGGADVVLVSLGRSGALLVTEDGPRQIVAPAVRARSSVGAGDCMVAGFVCMMAKGAEVYEAARYGVAAGTAAVLTPGTELCRREDVERLYADMQTRSRAVAQGDELMLGSPAFEHGGEIPAVYSRYGENLSPPLVWSGGGERAREYAVVCEDPDVPGAAPFVHWIVYGIPAHVRQLDEGDTHDGWLGVNDLGRMAYDGPAPVAGTEHDYHFRVFALDAPLELEPPVNRFTLLGAMRDHVVAEADLVGHFGKR